MARIKKDARGTASCAECMFGRPVTIVDRDPKGVETGRREVCECHVARPTRYGFPAVRLDDFCALHVDAKTAERTFAGLVAASAAVVA